MPGTTLASCQRFSCNFYSSMSRADANKELHRPWKCWISWLSRKFFFAAESFLKRGKKSPFTSNQPLLSPKSIVYSRGCLNKQASFFIFLWLRISEGISSRHLKTSCEFDLGCFSVICIQKILIVWVFVNWFVSNQRIFYILPSSFKGMRYFTIRAI